MTVSLRMSLGVALLASGCPVASQDQASRLEPQLPGLPQGEAQASRVEPKVEVPFGGQCIPATEVCKDGKCVPGSDDVAVEGELTRPAPIFADAGAGDAGTGHRILPTLQQATLAATAIAFGQVERIETKDGVSIGTLRVEHLAKGDLPQAVAFEAPRRERSQEPLRLGAWMLAFLEPSGFPTPQCRLVFAGDGMLHGFERSGVAHVTMSEWGGLQFPAALADPGSEQGPHSGSAPLAKVLAAVGLPEPKPVARKDATFRVATRECGECALATQLGKVGMGETDCGRLGVRQAKPSVLACVREALKGKRPFRVSMALQGVDSAIEQAFVSTGTEHFALWYDSTVEGGGQCAAGVWRWPCASLAVLDAARDGRRVECREPGARMTVCSQEDHRVENLGPALPVGRLHCREQFAPDNFGWCQVDAPQAGRRDHVPPADGADLLCRLSRTEGLLHCHAE